MEAEVGKKNSQPRANKQVSQSWRCLGNAYVMGEDWADGRVVAYERGTIQNGPDFKRGGRQEASEVYPNMTYRF